MVGNSGSGKSTLARGLAARLGVPFLELDSVYHQPGWEPLAEDEFQRLVTQRVSADGWVVDGNYSATLVTAIEAFQTANGLTADGVIGPMTWQALLAYAPAPVTWTSTGA